MAEKISREELRDLIDKLKPKKEPAIDYEAFGQLAQSTQKSSPDNLAMIMLAMMGNNKGGGSAMEKLMEIQASIAAMNALQNLGGNSGNTDKVAEMMKQMSEQSNKQMQQFQDMLMKREADEKEERRHREMLELIAKVGEKKGNDGDPALNALIALVTNKDKVSPLDLYDRINKDTSERYETQRKRDEEHNKEKIELMNAFQNQMRDYIETHSGDASAMQELSRATETLDQFQTYAKRLGWVTPAKEEGESDKLDWRFLLNRALDIATNVSGAVNKPKRNPNMMDYSKEAGRLYKKYKDSVQTPDHTPLTPSWLEEQLRKNPNLERDWDRALVEYNSQSVQQASTQPAAEQSGTQQAEPEPEIEVEEPEEYQQEEPEEPEEDEPFGGEDMGDIYGREVGGM